MTSTARKRPAIAVWVAVTILFIAFSLRIWRLDVQSFWWDEAYSTMVASSGLRSIVATLAREDFHPPLHYFILHFWMQVAGRSEFALRLASVAAGVLTVAAAWITARRLYTRSAAPIAALLFALSPFLWYYSQETRMFALVPLFGTFALYFCARAVQGSRRWPWTAYTVAIALGLYSLYYAIFLPFVCGFWILLLGRRYWPDFRDWAVATTAAFIFYAPWLPIFLSRSEAWSSTFTPNNNPIKVVIWSWPEFVMGLPNLALYQQTVPTVLLGFAALAAAGSLGFAWLIRHHRPGALLAALAFAVPLLTIAAISAIKPVYHPRYAIPVIAGLYLALAGLIDYLSSRPDPHPNPLPEGEGTPPLSISVEIERRQGGGGLAAESSSARSPRSTTVRRFAGLVVAVVLASCFGYGLYHLEFDSAYARDNYRGAIAYLRNLERPGDTILDNAIPPFWYYDHGPAPATYFPTGPYTEVHVVDELNRLTTDRSRLWYVQQMAIPNDPDGFVDTQLRLHSKRLSERWFGAIRVQLWQLSPADRFTATAFRPVSANLANELSLTGYSASGEAVGGRKIDVELQWLVQRTPRADDGFWVGLADSAGHTWGRADTRPRDAAYSLSSAWPAGETVVTRFDLPIDVGTPPGHYQLVGGVYQLSDLAGLDVLDADQHPIGQQFVLGQLDVSRPTLGTTDPSLPNQLAIDVLPGLSLAADRIGSTTLAPGDRLPITLLWKATGSLSALNASLRLRTPSGQIIAQDDRVIGDTFPTERWQAGELIREQRTLELPASAPAGPAALSLVLSNGQTVSLGTVAISRVVRDFTAPSPAHPLHVTFGNEISLIGYDLSGNQAKPGDQITVTLAWKDLRTTTTSYHVFVHLLDQRNQIQAQWDGVPKNWTYPTSAWVPGEYVVDHYPLKVSSDAPAGNLTLEVGLYGAATGKRLTATSSPGAPTADRVVLGSVRVDRK